MQNSSVKKRTTSQPSSGIASFSKPTLKSVQLGICSSTSCRDLVRRCPWWLRLHVSTLITPFATAAEFSYIPTPFTLQRWTICQQAPAPTCHLSLVWFSSPRSLPSRFLSFLQEGCSAREEDFVLCFVFDDCHSRATVRRCKADVHGSFIWRRSC